MHCLVFLKDHRSSCVEIYSRGKDEKRIKRHSRQEMTVALTCELAIRAVVI